MAALNTDGSLRETGLRRLTKALSFLLAMLCILALGGIGGGWAGLWLAFQAGILGFILLWVTCPLGGFFGLWLAKGLGQGFAHLMSSYRLAFPGLLLGIAGGVFYFSLSLEASKIRLHIGDLGFEQWMTLSLSAAIGGLLFGLVAMTLDALTNFTR
jgi:hypothetical protein